MTSLHAQIRKTKHFVPNWTLKGMENDTPANQTKCFSLHCSQPNKDVKAIDVMHSHICSWPLAIHPVLAMSGLSKVVRCQSLHGFSLLIWLDHGLRRHFWLMDFCLSPHPGTISICVLIHLIHLTSCSGFSFFKVLHKLTRATEKQLLTYFCQFFLRFGFSLRY